MNSLRKLLWPLSLLYNAVTHLRNQAFNKGLLSSQSYPIPIICIGNLSTGGTGKSPMVEFILALLSKKKVAVVSRGYGRKTRGVIEVTTNHNAQQVGDEPLQIKLNYPNACVVVSEKRTLGIEEVLRLQPDTALVLLDDAFQHRYVKPQFTIMLTSFDSLFTKDLVLPAGNLRESRKGAKRANLLVVTKCPANLTDKRAKQITLNIQKYSANPVFFSTIEYQEALNHHQVILPKQSKVVLLSGIAKAAPLKAYVSKHYQLIEHKEYKDHHFFSSTQILEIEKIMVEDKLAILTTQKDFMRIKNQVSEKILEQIFVLGIKTKFLFDENEKFNQFIFNLLKE